MSTNITISECIERLYPASKSLRQIAEGLPEAAGGLSFLLQLLSEEVQCSASSIDDEKPQAAGSQ